MKEYSGSGRGDKLDYLGRWNEYQYQCDRFNSYPSVCDQLDMQYWDQVNGTTTWKDAIEAVKTKWPKDNTGPVEQKINN